MAVGLYTPSKPEHFCHTNMDCNKDSDSKYTRNKKQSSIYLTNISLFNNFYESRGIIEVIKTMDLQILS
jgi:hypothetical protein